MLAQQAPLPPSIGIAWSSFAPELAAAGTALVLVLMVAVRGRRLLAAVPAGLLVAGVGAWLVVTGPVAPGVVAVVAGLGGLAVAVGWRARPQLVRTGVAATGLGAALALTVWQLVGFMPASGAVAATTALQGSIAVDGVALFTRLSVYGAGLLVLPLGHGYLADRGLARPEFEPLLLLAATGMAALGAANDLITVFVALETLSVALYVLCGLARRDRRSQEASLKYLVLGAVASAILVYGMALVYVATGSLQLGAIGAGLQLARTPLRMGVLGLALVTVGLAFKTGLVPFHLWVPDVYQGAPTNVTAFMAAGTKAAGFAALLRLYLVAFGGLAGLWVPLLAALAGLTMVYGAVVALAQRDLKRILAYSSLAHAGYATVGVVAASPQGLAATLWYLLTYAVGVLTAFGAVLALERRRRGEVALVDLRGLGRQEPVLAGVLTLGLLSLAGLPPTAGFAGKWVVFAAGVEAGLTWLVIVAVVSSVVAAFFYLRLMGMMFLEDPAEPAQAPVVSTGLSLGVAAAAAAVVYLGVQPQVILDVAEATAVLAQP